jgi:hypothetical protein
MGWAKSGQAWGERAADWAYLMEPYARRANDALFGRAGPGKRLLDIACGSATRPALRPAAGSRSQGWTPPRR